MSFREADLSTADLLGNVAVDRNEQPLVRGSIRRHDPDGGSSVPYYSGLSGKTLSIRYTDASLVEVDDDIAFGSDSYPAMLAAINALDSTNIEAVDLGGFPGIRNKNTGDQHYVAIAPFATPASDAAPIAGFAVEPFPGSISYAGEIASTPAMRSQGNRQGTALLGDSEDLSSRSFNRGFLSILRYVERMKADMEREVNGLAYFGGTVAPHPISTSIYGFFINDPTIRIAAGGQVIPDSSWQLVDQFKLVTDFGENVIDDTLQQTTVLGIFYADGTTAINPSASFATWGTKDGGSIYGPTVPTKEKHAATAITAIHGNVVTVTGATFGTKHVQKGDYVKISGATNSSPFSHNGWFIVDQFIDAENLLLRPMSRNEFPLVDGEEKPSELNPKATGSYGDLTVYMGVFIPLAGVFVHCSSELDGATVNVRAAAGVPFRDMRIDQTAGDMAQAPNIMGRAIKAHIDDTSSAHAAASIGGFTSTETWKDGSTISGADLKATIENILTDLKNITTGQGGTRRIGGDDISIVGSAPNAMAAASLRDQLIDLLTKLQTHVNDGVAHAGAGATYSGSNNWADGSHINAGVTIDQAIDAIVDALGISVSDAGAAKVSAAARPAWLGGRTNPGSTSVQAALDKIVNDLGATTAADDGAERIGAAAATDLASGSVRSQLDLLAAGWAKLSRANTFSAKQAFNGASGDTNAAMETTASPVARKLLWEINAGLAKVRMYATNGAAFEFTLNCSWDGTNWNKDSSVIVAYKLVYQSGLTSNNYLKAFHRSSSTAWNDSSWTASNLLLSFDDGYLKVGYKPASNQLGGGDKYTQNNNIKCWGNVHSVSGTATVVNGYNVDTVTFGGSAPRYLEVNMGDTFASANDYVVFPVLPQFVLSLTYTVDRIDGNTFRIKVFNGASQVDLSDAVQNYRPGFIVVGVL